MKTVVDTHVNDRPMLFKDRGDEEEDHLTLRTTTEHASSYVFFIYRATLLV